MSISCSCDFDDCDWYYTLATDFALLATKRSRKCCSCGTKINVGDDMVTITRWRDPRDAVEDRIYGYGGEVSMAPLHLCETCGGLLWAVQDLGMCCDITKNIKQQIKEYMGDQ